LSRGAPLATTSRGPLSICIDGQAADLERETERILLVLTLLTGFLGLILQSLLPRRLRGFTEEVPVDQVPFLCRRWCREADDLLVQVQAALPPENRQKAKEMEDAYLARIRPFLREPWPPVTARRVGSAESLNKVLPELPAPCQGPLTPLESLIRSRQGLLLQQRLHWWLHSWLLVHVPLATGLLVLGLVHALVSVLF
jgi:hypothetical protein